MKILIKRMILTVTILLVTNCSTFITKPLYLPYDHALDKKVDERKEKMIKEKDVSVSDINQQLNDYETLKQKSKKVITENNKLAGVK